MLIISNKVNLLNRSYDQLLKCSNPEQVNVLYPEYVNNNYTLLHSEYTCKQVQLLHPEYALIYLKKISLWYFV